MSGETRTIHSEKAYYYNSITGFIIDSPESIIGQLVRLAFGLVDNQRDAWVEQISELQNRLNGHGIDGDIIFEYDIVRLGKRIDVVLLIRHIVFSLEFKNGKEVFVAQDARQAEDYALDIKNFHKESEDLYVCPILVATKAKPYSKEQKIDCYSDKQIFLQRENIETLIPKLSEITEKYGSDEKIDFDRWFNSPYNPTPTIIAAAIEAYNTHNLSEIANSKAGQDKIELCEKKIFETIDYARINKKKCICLVTGVPGAGKTLVGLDIVAGKLRTNDNGLGVYISGNGPLVEVLREALERSVKASGKLTKETKTSIQLLIQSSFAFKKDNKSLEKLAPPEKVLVFDEAQRCWNEDQMRRKHKDKEMEMSEPHLFYQIMNKHKDWAVIVCLVGLGQDIHDGEVGINEWFRCGIEDYPEWEMYYSPNIFEQSEDRNIDRKMIESCDRCYVVPELHLSVPIRTFKSDNQSKFVDSLLDNDPENAKLIYKNMFDSYPLFITRDIEKAKKWARSKVRGTQRCGMLACSSAQRLKPEGIYVPKDIDVKNWFLADSDDLRSSNMMEVVASEFKVQGLEIDWAVVCWDLDLRRGNKGWAHYNFRGSGWQRRNSEEQKRYLVNSYRVLLTRARQGMVIFVPRGVDKEEDTTRDMVQYDALFHYLLSCGITEI